MTLKDLIKKVQGVMNLNGSSLTVDGDFGPVTSAELDKYDLAIRADRKTESSPPPTPAPTASQFLNAPWIFADIDLLGLSETDPKLNARFAPHWANVGLPGYKTLAGNAHAWCSLLADAVFLKVGLKGTKSAAAASWSSWGRDAAMWFGAVLPIRHKSGGRHVCFFLYWIDQSTRTAAVLGGNQGDHFSIASMNLSGNVNGHDEVFPGPRWPMGWPDGKFQTREQVLAAYPTLTVGGSGSSTR